MKNPFELYMNEEGDLVFWNPLFEQYLYYSSRYDTTAVVANLDKYLQSDKWVQLHANVPTPPPTKKRGRPSKSTK